MMLCELLYTGSTALEAFKGKVRPVSDGADFQDSLELLLEASVVLGVPLFMVNIMQQPSCSVLAIFQSVWIAGAAQVCGRTWNEFAGGEATVLLCYIPSISLALTHCRLLACSLRICLKQHGLPFGCKR